MTHGQPVTLADMKGITDPNHYRGKYRVGFGMDALDPTVIVGNWTHFVVNSLADSGSRTLRDALSVSNRYITFDPAIGGTGVGTITIASTLFYPINYFVDGRGVRITITGAAQTIAKASSTPGRKGWMNIIFRNGAKSSSPFVDMLSFAGINGTGRQHIFLGWNEFHNDGTQRDDAIDISFGPTLGYYITEVGNWLGPETTGSFEIVHIFGNEVPTQNNHHNRMTMIRAAYYAGSAGASNRVRFRMPELRDAHLEHMECYTEWAKEGVILWNTTSTNRIKFRSRFSIWDSAKNQPSPDPARDRAIYSHGSALALADSRVENAIKMIGSAADPTLPLYERNRDLVTDATMYVDEFGSSISQYNNYTPGLDFVGMTDAQKRQYIRDWSRWFDTVTLGGTALAGGVAGDLAGETLTFTNSVDNWPAWTNTQKNLFIASSQGGTSWDAVKALLGSGDITVSGKTVTLTFPAGVNAVGFPVDEDVRFPIVSSLTTRSAYTEPDDIFTVTADEGEPPPPGAIVENFISDWTGFVQREETSPGVFAYVGFFNSAVWTGSGFDGVFITRSQVQFNLASLSNLALVSQVRILLNIENVFNGTGQNYQLRLWPEEVVPQSFIGSEETLFIQSNLGDVYSTIGTIIGTGVIAIDITSPALIDRIHEVAAGSSPIDNYIAFTLNSMNEPGSGHRIEYTYYGGPTPPVLELTYTLEEDPPIPPEVVYQVVIQ